MVILWQLCRCEKNKPHLADYGLILDTPSYCCFFFSACLKFLYLALLFQGLLKKHEAFETDFTVHRDRVNDVCSNGDELIKKVQYNFYKVHILQIYPFDPLMIYYRNFLWSRMWPDSNIITSYWGFLCRKTTTWRTSWLKWRPYVGKCQSWRELQLRGNLNWMRTLPSFNSTGRLTWWSPGLVSKCFLSFASNLI